MTQTELHILDSLQIRINSDFSRNVMDDFFEMAARINPKRSFLFVSKVLAKHLPCKAEALLSKGADLANAYVNAQRLKKSEAGRFFVEAPTLFVGFAETATGLAQAVYECFEGNCLYCHTTRDVIEGLEGISFQEEHSHATDHWLYLPEGYDMSRFEQIVLIDDELTTGKTALNIISEMHDRYGIEKYCILTLLDWRSEESRGCFQTVEDQRHIEAPVYALISGSIDVTGALDSRREDYPATCDEKCKPVERILVDLRACFPDRRAEQIASGTGLSWFDYNELSGRFGVTPEQQRVLEDCCKKAAVVLEQRISEEKLIFMGFEELIYLPVKIAESMNCDIRCQSVTRSPIFSDESDSYPINSKYRFLSPKFGSYTNYFYNIDPTREAMVLFFEGSLDHYQCNELQAVLDRLPLERVYLVCV